MAEISETRFNVMKKRAAEGRKAAKLLINKLDGVVSWYEYFSRDDAKLILRVAGMKYQEWIGEDDE